MGRFARRLFWFRIIPYTRGVKVSTGMVFRFRFSGIKKKRREMPGSVEVGFSVFGKDKSKSTSRASPEAESWLLVVGCFGFVVGCWLKMQLQGLAFGIEEIWSFGRFVQRLRATAHRSRLKRLRFSHKYVQSKPACQAFSIGVAWASVFFSSGMESKTWFRFFAFCSGESGYSWVIWLRIRRISFQRSAAGIARIFSRRSSLSMKLLETLPVRR